MKRVHVTLVATLLAVASGGATGAQTGPDVGDLDGQIAAGPAVAHLVRRAYEANPDIQAARENWRAVVERYRTSTAYPDPQLMVTYFPQPIETRLGPQDWNATLSQMIPFPGKLSKAGELVEADARMARLELDKAVRDVIVRLRESFHELLYVRDAQRTVAANQELLDHLRTLAETSYAEDRAAFVDVTKAQSQAAQLQYDALLLAELGETEQAQLNAVLNRPPGAPIGPLVAPAARPLVYELDEIYPLAEQNQEEIQMAQTRVEKAQAREGLARFENLPDFRVGLFYAGIGEPDVPMQPEDAGRDAVGIQAGLTIPLWFGRNASRVAGAQAEVGRARAQKVSRVNETRAQVRSLYFRLRNAERLIQLYEQELLPQAAQALETSETWFREGEGSFSDFVETQSTWYNFQLSLARARADRGKFLARLERLVGRSLTERGDPSGRPGSGEESQ